MQYNINGVTYISSTVAAFVIITFYGWGVDGDWKYWHSHRNKISQNVEKGKEKIKTEINKDILNKWKDISERVVFLL